MSEEKTAFIFDTNFIIENPNLKEVVANLSSEFSVYITQISIDERISQKYIELKNKFARLKQLTDEYKDIADIKIITPFDQRFGKEKRSTEKVYKTLFKDRIIPFASDNSTLFQVLDRVYKKIPPFLSVDGASDKGLKDTLIWLSLLAFFKDEGESAVIFVTNDNGFRKNAGALCSEFQELTGKQIEIKDNSYYKSRLEAKEPEFTPGKKEAHLPDINQLREKIHNIIHALCEAPSENRWGDLIYEKTFRLTRRIDSYYIEHIFKSLRQDINDHIFEVEVPANMILDLDERVQNEAPISLASLENALSLYEEIRQRLPDFLPQFFNAAAAIINKNYVEPNESVTDNDMPF